MASKHGLGRGLSALINEMPAAAGTPGPAPVNAGTPLEGMTTVPVDKIRPNPKQPRRRFAP